MYVEIGLSTSMLQFASHIFYINVFMFTHNASI
jgi:hypothetical protein